MSAPAPSKAFEQGVNACIAWLQIRALKMNDLHARLVLNSAAFSLGQHKPTFGKIHMPKPRGAISGERPLTPNPITTEGLLERRWYIRREHISWTIIRDVRPGFVQYLGRDRVPSGKPRYFRQLASAEKVCDRANRELALPASLEPTGGRG